MTQFIQSLCVSLLGQSGAPASDAASAAQVQSVWDFVIKGGPVMIPIAACSLAALTVFVERLVSLRRANIIPPRFLEGLKAVLIDVDEDREKALEYCRADGSPLADIFAAGIRKLGRPLETIEKAVQDAGEREVQRLRKHLRLLAVIASISPLLGLLGTIFGMIEAFQTVAVSAEAMGKTELLAKGIYEAMITTAAGLIVAIPVLVAYNWITARIDRLVAEMDATTVEFIETFADAPPASRRLDESKTAEHHAALRIGAAATAT